MSDSGHHRIVDEGGEIANYFRETVIGDNVWVGVEATVMKGAKIQDGCAIGINSIVGGRVKEHLLVMNEPARPFSEIHWSAEGFGDFK